MCALSGIASHKELSKLIRLNVVDLIIVNFTVVASPNHSRDMMDANNYGNSKLLCNVC